MPTMLWLGFWQLDKSEHQQARRDAFAAADSPALPVSALEDPMAQAFTRVETRGSYLSDRTVLIDNIVRGGRNGFFVVTPFRQSSGALLLVNRGWIPQTPRRQPIGDLQVDAGLQTLSGRVGSLPVGGLRLGDPEPTGGPWPRILQFPTVEDVSALLGQPLEPWVLLTDPDDSSTFLRSWEPGGLPPERHLGYAVQWFAMCLALTVLAGWVWIKRTRSDETP